MNRLELPLSGIVKEYASGWDEIRRRDAAYVGRCLHWLERGEIDVDMFRKLVVDRLIGRVNSKVMPMQGEKAWNMWANEGLLADSVDFFFKKGKNGEGQETIEVIPNFVKNLLPWVRVGWRRLWGPGDFLGEMSFVEYKDLLFCADKYMKTKDPDYLTRMMAIGYRPRRLLLWLLKRMPGFDGRMRVRYNPGAVDYRMRLFGKLDIGAKYIFFEYLMGCLYMLRNDGEGSGIEIDGELCSFSLLFKKGSSAEAGEEEEESGIGLTGLLMSLAESGVFGTIKETASADVWDVLVRLYQLELQRREMDRKFKMR